MKLLKVVVGVAVLVAGVVYALAPLNAAVGGRVLVIGDSVPHSWADDLKPLMTARGVTLVQSTFPGASACDMSGNGAWNRRQRANVVVVSFRGNSYTPCMDPATTPQQVAELTAAHVRWICATAGAARCVIVGQMSEVAPSDMTVDTNYLNDLYAWYAAIDGREFVDCGALVDGDVTLRHPDGFHYSASGQTAAAQCVANAI